MNTKNVIEFYYNKLGFPESFNSEFYSILDKIEVDAHSTIEGYDADSENGQKNLLYYLYFCDRLKEKYDEKGISHKILYDTLSDITRWAKVWSKLKGELYLGETGWLKRILTMSLFRIGRLQFFMGKARYDIPEYGLSIGDDVLEIHIPPTEPLTKDLCLHSVYEARKFFAKYYPGYKYKCITCNSWLLDRSLKEILGEDSNILQFQTVFDIIIDEKCDNIIKFVFNWDTTRDNLNDIICPKGFPERVKKRINDGGYFNTSLGIFKM